MLYVTLHYSLPDTAAQLSMADGTEIDRILTRKESVLFDVVCRLTINKTLWH